MFKSLLLFMLLAVALATTSVGTDCSSTSSVCDRDSECCGTGTPDTSVTSNGVSASDPSITVCQNKD